MYQTSHDAVNATRGVSAFGVMLGVQILQTTTRISIVKMIIQVYLLFEKPAHDESQLVWPIKPLRRMEEDLKVDTTKDPNGWKQVEVTP